MPRIIRRVLVGTLVLCLVLAGAVYLLGFAIDQAIGVRLPHQVAAASVIGTVIDADVEWLTFEDRNGTTRRLPEPELHLTIYAPLPGILPEAGDLVLTADIRDETYYIFAGATDGCRHAVEFRYAFDQSGSIVGAAGGGLGRGPSGFRLPKASDFRALDPPDWRGRWYDYRVVFCLNDAGEVVDGELFGANDRTLADRRLTGRNQLPGRSGVPHATQ